MTFKSMNPKLRAPDQYAIITIWGSSGYTDEMKLMLILMKRITEIITRNEGVGSIVVAAVF